MDAPTPSQRSSSAAAQRSSSVATAASSSASVQAGVPMLPQAHQSPAGYTGCGLLSLIQFGTLILPNQPLPSASQDPIIKAFFIDDKDEDTVRETFMHYIKPDEASRPVIEVHVPGDNRKCLARSDQARKGTHALIAWSLALFDEGYYLDGEFTRDDFAVDLLGNLRGRKNLIPIVKRVEKATSKEILSKQMVSVAKIVEDIHQGTAKTGIPSDLKHLLDQLRKDEVVCSLILSHASHADEDSKDALFLKMYKDLRVMEELDPSACNSIIRVIETIPDVQGWIESAMKNTHLHSLLRYKQSRQDSKVVDQVLYKFLSAGVRYPQNAIGLLDFRRNGDAQLEMDYSLDTIGYAEAALFGASLCFNTYYQHQLQEKQLQWEQEKQDFHTERNAEQQKIQDRQRKEWQPKHQMYQEQRQRLQRQQKLQMEHQKEQEFYRNLHQQQQQWHQEVYQEKWQRLMEGHQSQQDQLLLQHIPIHIQDIMIVALTDFLTGENAPISVPAAMAGTRAIATYIGTVELLEELTDQPQIVAEALRRAQEAAQLEAATPAKGAPPVQMLTSRHIHYMHELVAPNLLVGLQYLMFQNGHCYRFGNDAKLPKL